MLVVAEKLLRRIPCRTLRALCQYSISDPGACAPGFMLSHAPRAWFWLHTSAESSMSLPF